MGLQLFTVGHSTHSLEEFLALLTRHGIEVLADIRRFPGSRKFPHFNRENLETSLSQAGIGYQWIELLGGRRPKTTGETLLNLGLRNASFRNYADYMASEEFRTGIQQLIALGEQRPTAYMCSESVFWRCHRRLVSDYLLSRNITVQHIMPSGELRPHTLTSGAKIAAGQVTYPEQNSGSSGTLF